MARTRGITVRTLDLTGMTAAPVYEYAMATGPDGTVYVICSEGVGWQVTPDRPLIVDTWSGEVTVILDDVRTAAAAGTDVDLADHVRTFGSRLDSNHAMWVRRLTPVPAPGPDRVPMVRDAGCMYCRRYNRPCGRHES